MAKFEFPKIELSDKQKKVARAMAIALGMLLLILIVGVILQKGKDTRGTAPAATTDQTATSGTGVFAGFRNLMSGARDSDIEPQLPDPTEAETSNLPSTISGSNLASELQAGFRDTVTTSQEQQRQIAELQRQLAEARRQLEVYQASLQNSGNNPTSPAATATINGMQQQITNFQTQVNNATVNYTFATLQQIYYYCHGIPTPPASSPISLNSISNGTVQLFDANGNFNTALCANLPGFIDQIAAWAAANGYDVAGQVFTTAVTNFINVVSYLYCNQPTLNQICNRFSAIGPQFARFNGRYNVSWGTFTMPRGYDPTRSNYTTSQMFTQVPWVTQVQQTTVIINQTSINLFLFFQVNLNALFNMGNGSGGSSASTLVIDQIAARNTTDVYINPEQSLWQDGTLELRGVVTAGGLPVSNLKLGLRLAQRPVNIPVGRTAAQVFRSMTSYSMTLVKFIVPSSMNPNQLEYLETLSFPGGGIAEFEVIVTGLNPASEYMFDFIDRDYRVVIN